MSGQSATIASLAAFACNSQDLTWNERKGYIAYADPQALIAKITALQSPMPASGKMVVNGANFDITTDNGKVFPIALGSLNSSNTNVQTVANAYQLARLEQAVADLLVADNNTGYTAPGYVDQARVALVANLAPLDVNINDYLGQYVSLPAEMTIEIQNGAGNALEYRTTSDILPPIYGVYTEGTTSANAQFVYLGDLTQTPYSLTATQAQNFQASVNATAFGTGTTITYSATTGLTTIVAGTSGSLNAGLAAAQAANLQVSFNISDLSSTVAYAGAAKNYASAGAYLKNTFTTSTVEKFALVYDPGMSGQNQPAVDWAASSNNGGTYLAQYGPIVAKYRLEALRINTTLAAVGNVLAQMATEDYNASFNAATTDVNEITAIRAVILPKPSIAAVIAAGSSITPANIAQLSDFGDYLVSIGLSNSTYNTWAPVVLRNATAPDGYVYSPQRQYRASNNQSDLSYSGAQVIAMEALLGSKGPTNLATATILVGSGSVQVYEVDSITGNYPTSTTTMGAATLYMRVETRFTPGVVLSQGQFSAEGIVAYFNDSGTAPSLDSNSASSSITLAFNNMTKESKFALALNALESYLNGSQSIVEQVAAYALANNLASGAGTTDIALLASYVLGGISAQISTTKFLGTNATGAQFLVAAAINVLILNQDGFAPLGNETVVKALKKAELLRQVQNVDAFDSSAGILTGVVALGGDTVMNFTAPTNTVAGVSWTATTASTVNKLPAVKEVYDALTTYSGFTFNDAEKAHLLHELLLDFISINSTLISAANWMSIENYVSKSVWKQYFAQYTLSSTAGATVIGVAPPLQAGALRSAMINSTNTDAQREAAWDALFVLMFDLVELTTTSSTVSSSAIVSPGVASGSDMKAIFETILDVGTFSVSADILVFLKAFFDLDIIGDMELNTLSLPVSIPPTTWSDAVGDLFSYAGSAVAQYSTSANSISNITEISLSASNALRIDGATLRPVLNNPATLLTNVITQIGNTGTSFNAQMVLMEAIADPSTRTIGPSLKRELELAGFSQGVIEAYVFVVAQLSGRQITGAAKYLMFDASAA